MRYPYVIIDSDQKASDTIFLALKKRTEYTCIGIANTEGKALDIILEKKPLLVFLEPEVLGRHHSKTSYNILLELHKYMTRLPQFVVITNTTQYAIEGIRNNILDYILKPLCVSQLTRAFLRFEKNMQHSEDNMLCFKSYGDYRFVDVDEILYLKADNNTTDFIMNNGNNIEAFKTLKHFQELLPDYFVRIHNSYIINTNYVSRIHFGKAKCSIKNTQDMIPFSKSYKDRVEGIKDNLTMKSLIHI